MTWAPGPEKKAQARLHMCTVAEAHQSFAFLWQQGNQRPAWGWYFLTFRKESPRLFVANCKRRFHANLGQSSSMKKGLELVAGARSCISSRSRKCCWWSWFPTLKMGGLSLPFLNYTETRHTKWCLFSYVVWCLKSDERSSDSSISFRSCDRYLCAPTRNNDARTKN